MNDYDGDGYSVAEGDCKDFDDKVHPGTDNWNILPYTTDTGAKSFDYNCDGIEEKHTPDLVNWDYIGCNYGWHEQVPECGEKGLFIYVDWSIVTGCTYREEHIHDQRCR
jgi:hypothetical protein